MFLTFTLELGVQIFGLDVIIWIVINGIDHLEAYEFILEAMQLTVLVLRLRHPGKFDIILALCHGLQR